MNSCQCLQHQIIVCSTGELTEQRRRRRHQQRERKLCFCLFINNAIDSRCANETEESRGNEVNKKLKRLKYGTNLYSFRHSLVLFGDRIWLLLFCGADKIMANIADARLLKLNRSVRGHAVAPWHSPDWIFNSVNEFLTCAHYSINIFSRLAQRWSDLIGCCDCFKCPNVNRNNFVPFSFELCFNWVDERIHWFCFDWFFFNAKQIGAKVWFILSKRFQSLPNSISFSRFFSVVSCVRIVRFCAWSLISCENGSDDRQSHKFRSNGRKTTQKN